MKKICISLAISLMAFIQISTAQISTNIVDVSTSTVLEEKILNGSDRDSHGCIPSAGYMWEDTLKKCVRVWEINKESRKDIIKIQENLIEKGFLKLPKNIKKGYWGQLSKKAYQEYFKSLETKNTK